MKSRKCFNSYNETTSDIPRKASYIHCKHRTRLESRVTYPDEPLTEFIFVFVRTSPYRDIWQFELLTGIAHYVFPRCRVLWRMRLVPAVYKQPTRKSSDYVTPIKKVAHCRPKLPNFSSHSSLKKWPFLVNYDETIHRLLNNGRMSSGCFFSQCEIMIFYECILCICFFMRRFFLVFTLYLQP